MEDDPHKHFCVDVGNGCFKCGASDHIAKNCDVKQQQQKYILKDVDRQHGGGNNSRLVVSHVHVDIFRLLSHFSSITLSYTELIVPVMRWFLMEMLQKVQDKVGGVRAMTQMIELINKR